MRCLLFSFLAVVFSCASEYRALTPASVDLECFDKIFPRWLGSRWYDASVDVAGKHISGLLVVKKDSAFHDQVVFMNEAGIKYLHFAWSADKFTVHHILPQLDKKAVIKLLQRDFSMVTGRIFKPGPGLAGWKTESEYFIGRRLSDPDETLYMITSLDCSTLQRAEIGTKKKKIVSVNYEKNNDVLIRHHTFDMTINLKKIDKE